MSIPELRGFAVSLNPKPKTLNPKPLNPILKDLITPGFDSYDMLLLAGGRDEVRASCAV